jgi:NAD(P)H-hydrate epimerase
LITVPCNTPFPDPKVVRELSARTDALVVGCGVVKTSEAHRALRSIIQNSQTPVVVDAEALHAIAEAPGTELGKRVLLTPNAGEYQVLSGKNWPGTTRNRENAVRTLAIRYRSTVIVKGALDFISDGERVAVDIQGSPYMTKGGYGDLLAGMAAALLARGHAPFDAARAAAYIVGRAGEIASQKWGEGTLASDVLTMLPAVIKQGRN